MREIVTGDGVKGWMERRKRIKEDGGSEIQVEFELTYEPNQDRSKCVVMNEVMRVSRGYYQVSSSLNVSNNGLTIDGVIKFAEARL